MYFKCPFKAGSGLLSTLSWETRRSSTKGTWPDTFARYPTKSMSPQFWPRLLTTWWVLACVLCEKGHQVDQPSSRDPVWHPNGWYKYRDDHPVYLPETFYNRKPQEVSLQSLGSECQLTWKKRLSETNRPGLVPTVSPNLSQPTHGFEKENTPGGVFFLRLKTNHLHP